jgi:hypothetical protein
MYHITPYTYNRAKQNGLKVVPSKHKGKKLDVYKDGKFIHAVGAIGYKDYPTYLKEDGKEIADQRKRLYHLRHTQNTQGERLAKLLLW